jgi:uronate dehydrogenase
VRLLITGAAGNMGRLLRPLLRRDDRVLRLADRVEIDDPAPGDETVLVDVTDPTAVGKACQDVDAVLHLGGLSTEAPFDDILAVNVVGTHNLLRAAVDAGVSRVILASSNHAAGFYRRGLATWLAPADAANLIEACLTAPRPGFRVVWAISDNARRWWSLKGARELGYEPHDDAERFAAARIAEFGEPDPADPVHDLVGGQHCVAPLGEPRS